MDIYFKRGSKEALDNYIGHDGEVIVDKTNNTLRIYNGITQGGFALINNNDLSNYATTQDLNEYLSASGGSLTGAITSTSSAQFSRIQESVITANDGACNCANGSFFIITPSANTTISLSNMVAGQTISIKIVNGGNYTITYPASWLWSEGNTPVLQSSGIDMIVVSYDGSSYIANAITNLTSSS